ncbi:hypothetical protein V5799_020381 [Amblyomma americanum]|uniref:Protein kinase domain-containing protein n=1 Tax=Amblyomma americanum TaxID=6943 RepID=A0AAQ4EU85_AMBAM
MWMPMQKMLAFLLQGGHAECYEFVDRKTNAVYAGKIVSKTSLNRPRLKQNMEKEIHIHKNLRHKHIVDFYSHFEDNDNHYIILELCRRESLVEMLLYRHTLTEAEVRYFLRQLLLACEYLVQERVIHRDLKLGNLLLTEDMQLKVADFGFATRVIYKGELKKICCGTPNYVAPEILARTGHSYEADIWSIGCIMYALLVGAPPFRSSSEKKTYDRIKNNQYQIPSTVSSHASTLIQWMLHPEPAKRPSIEAIMHHDFMTKGRLYSRMVAMLR